MELNKKEKELDILRIRHVPNTSTLKDEEDQTNQWRLRVKDKTG